MSLLSAERADTVSPADPDGRALARRLVVAAVLAIVLGALCYVLFIRTAIGQRFDNAAYLGARQELPGVRAADTDRLDQITAGSFALVLLALVALGGLRRRLRLGLAGALAAGVAVVVTDLLKKELLTRPFLVATDVLYPSNSFPSGHTATAVACALALMLVSPPRWRGIVAVVAGAYASVTATEVQAAGWHRPSDAIGGACVAFACVALVGAYVAWRRPVVTHWSRRHRLALIVVGAVGLVDAIAAAVGVLDVLRWLHGHGSGTPVTSGIRYDAYLTGISVTVLVVAGLVFALLALLGHVDLDHRGTRPGRT